MKPGKESNGLNSPLKHLSRSAVSTVNGWLDTARRIIADLDAATKAKRYRDIAESTMRLALLRRKVAKLPLLSELQSEEPDNALEVISHLGDAPRFLWALLAANQFLHDGRKREFEQAIALIRRFDYIPASGENVLGTLLPPCLVRCPDLLFRLLEYRLDNTYGSVDKAFQICTDSEAVALFQAFEDGGGRFLCSITSALREPRQASLAEKFAGMVRHDIDGEYGNSEYPKDASSRRRDLLSVAADLYIRQGMLDHGIELFQKIDAGDRGKGRAAQSLAESGHLDRALELASGISKPHEESFFLVEVIVELGKAGRLGEAFDLADQFSQESYPSGEAAKNRAATAALKAGYTQAVESILPRIKGKKEKTEFTNLIAQQHPQKSQQVAKLSVIKRAELVLAEAISRRGREDFEKCLAELRKIKTKVRGANRVRLSVLIARTFELLDDQPSAKKLMKEAVQEAGGITPERDAFQVQMWVAAGWFMLGERVHAEELVESAFLSQPDNDEIYELIYILDEACVVLDCFDEVWSAYTNPDNGNAWRESLVEDFAGGLVRRGGVEKALQLALSCPRESLGYRICRRLIWQLSYDKRFDEAIRVMEKSPLNNSDIEEFMKSVMAKQRADLAERALQLTEQFVASLPPWENPGLIARRLSALRVKYGLVSAWPEIAKTMIAAFPKTSGDEGRTIALEIARKLLAVGHCEEGVNNPYWAYDGLYYLNKAGSLEAYEEEMLARQAPGTSGIATLQTLAQTMHIKQGSKKRIEEILQMIQRAMASAWPPPKGQEDDMGMAGCLAIGEFAMLGYETNDWRERAEGLLRTYFPRKKHVVLAALLGNWDDALNRLRRLPHGSIEAERMDVATEIVPFAPLDELVQHARMFADELETAWLFCGAVGSRKPELKSAMAELIRPAKELWSA